MLLPIPCRGPIGKSLGKRRRESILSPGIKREEEGALRFRNQKSNISVVQIMSQNTINDDGQLDIIEQHLAFDIHELQDEELALVSGGILFMGIYWIHKAGRANAYKENLNLADLNIA